MGLAHFLTTSKFLPIRKCNFVDQSLGFFSWENGWLKVFYKKNMKKIYLIPTYNPFFYISIRNVLHFVLEKKLKPNVVPWKKKILVTRNAAIFHRPAPVNTWMLCWQPPYKHISFSYLHCHTKILGLTALKSEKGSTMQSQIHFWNAKKTKCNHILLNICG